MAPQHCLINAHGHLDGLSPQERLDELPGSLLYRRLAMKTDMAEGEVV